MRKLNRLLLIHWYTYDEEVIEFGDINFLTGKTAAGKSTIIDALQLVLLGDTNGNFFNKAANEKSVRTLKSYLFGENGDDGETGFRYLRQGPFTSYVVAEFTDSERKTTFLNGIVCDCYADLNFTFKWFTADKTPLPENLFVDEKTGVPLDIAKLKTWLKQHAKNRHEIIDTNRRYQEIILARYGSLKRKYLTLLKKAVPFSPITDIEKFITESVCDVKNNIQVEQMQSDIRQYKNLEADALRTEQRIKELKEIAAASEKYEAEKEKLKQQSYIVDRAEEEEYKEIYATLEKEAAARQTNIEVADRQMEAQQVQLSATRKEREQLETEYFTSDIVKKQQSLEAQLEKQQKELQELEESLQKTLQALRIYAAAFKEPFSGLRTAGYEVGEDTETYFVQLASISKEALKEVDFAAFSAASESEMEKIRQYEYELRGRIRQLEDGITELEVRIENLKKGIKPYPASVTGLKRRLEKDLFARYNHTVEISIFADLLEIKNTEWANAIEGYLDRQKFNLLVPEQYFTDACQIYETIKKEERLYDTGLVDVAKMRKQFQKQALPGSLAEEIETDHIDARLYADYLLGNVMKCEKVQELNRYSTAITKSVMLYKGYVTRKLNPARYADPFIGRRSMEIQLSQLSERLQEEQREKNAVSERLKIISRAAKCSVMSAYEAKQHAKTVKEAERIPVVEETIASLQKEYDGLDFTWQEQMKTKIDACKETELQINGQILSLTEEKARQQEQKKQIETMQMPQTAVLLEGVRAKIEQRYEETWQKETGEAVFEKELRSEARTRMSLKESFERACSRTRNLMEECERERRRRRSEYNQHYLMPYDIEREDNEEYDKELHVLADIRLPDYIDKIVDAKEKAYNQFRDDFIAKLKSNIESVREQIDELNYSLRNSVFGTDRYRFTMSPRAEYKVYYDMITDPMLMDTGGWNIASNNFNQKYQKEIDSLFKALIINETEVSAERRAEYERNIKKFIDYKTYLVFDLIVTNDQGEEQRLSKTLLKKSGGETQIPFYISLLASFSQVCRIKNKTNNNTVRVIILDEAFSKMDGERIRESIHLLRRFGLQVVFSAPPDKIPDIAPLADRNIAVFKSRNHSFTRHFDPAQIRDVSEDLTDAE